MQRGFTVLGCGNEVEIRLHGDGVNTPLVKIFRTARYTVVFIGRLYYRQELLVALAPYLPADLLEDAEGDDAALVLAAYQAQGRKGLTRLEGDFALVVWDGVEGHLIGLRDPLGGYPLYWTQHAGTTALGTGLYDLLDLLPRRTLDADYLADFLMLPGQVQELPTERCVYEGIHRVLAGTLVGVSFPTGRVDQETYWDWLDRRVDPGTDCQDQISERYGELLRRAVRERLQGRTASHLSGGMDSTSITLLARASIAAGVGESPLHTLSLVHERLSDFAAETPFIDSILSRHPDLCAHRIPADDLLDYDSCFLDPPPHDEPYAGLRRLGPDQATVEAAAACGAATMLTGIGADEMLVMNPFYLTDLLRRGRLGTAWAEACRWARVDNCSPWTILYPCGLANLLPGSWRAGLKAALRGGHAPWHRQNEWTIAPWITQEFARGHGLRDRAADTARRTFNACRPTGLSFALSLIRSRVGDVDRWCLGVPRGVAIAHPFLDSRVLCFGLGMQTRLQADPHGQKPILARAMRGVLPEHIVQRRRKCDFSPIHYRGLALHLPALETLIRQAPVDHLGLFDKEELLRCLRQAALGVASRADGLHRLDLTLSFLQWLSLQGAWQRPQASVRVLYAGRVIDNSERILV